MMVYYISRQRQLFQIFTQSIDAIDVTSVTLSRISVSMQFMSQENFECPLIHWSIGSLVPWFITTIGLLVHGTIGPMDHWSIGPLFY